MHTLSVFPQLLFLGSGLSPLLLRIVVSLFIFYIAKERKNKEYNYLYIANVIVSIALLLGLYTQIAVLLGLVLIKLDFYLNYWRNRKITLIHTEKYFLYFMTGVILASLIFTGPGAFAIDYPL